jgi:hypothetical protein
MSIASQDVYLNLTTPISVIGSGSGPAPLPANAVFSTISFPVSNQLTQGVINYNRLLSFNDSGTSVRNDFFLGTTGATGALPLSTNYLLMNSPSGTSASLALSAGDDANTYIIASLGGDFLSGSALNLIATGVNISSLNVSSINASSALNIMGSTITTSGTNSLQLAANNSLSVGVPTQSINFDNNLSTINISSTAPVKFSAVGINLGLIQNTTYGPDIGTVTISSINTSIISGVPVFTLAQYQALSTLAA